MADPTDPSVRNNDRYYQDRLVDNASSDPHLPDTRSRIRLLFLYPAEYGILIQGHLGTFELDLAPPYKALSYSWGDKTSSSIIRLGDGFHFRVRRNLEDALQRIRSPSETICVWIDGICINQADNDERSAQVGLMGEIFSGADEVMVWLGETRTLPGLEDALYGGAIGLAQQQERIWWHRLWVVQETVSAKKKPKIFFGASQLEWESFLLQWAEMCKRSQQPSAKVSVDEMDFLKSGLKALEMLSQLWDTVPEQRKLHRMLVQTRYHVCSDDHDRIYGLLYLMGPYERELFPPDYNSPTENVFAEATVQMLRTSSLGFDVLLRYWYRGSQQHQHSWWLDFAHPLPDSSIPFFCPGHRSAIKTVPGIELEICGDSELVRALGSSHSATTSGSQLSPLPSFTRLLRVSGVTFESIDFVRPFATFFEGRGKAFSLANLIDFYKDIRYRETRGKMTFFAPRSSRLKISRYRKQISDLLPEISGMRLGLVQSLVWIYRTYAAALSERMKEALNALESISDEVFRPEDFDTPIDRVQDRIEQSIQENLNFLMSRLFSLLANYAIFLTSNGFVGFCRYVDVSMETRETQRLPRLPTQGDIVVNFSGGSFPFILRESLDRRSFRESLVSLTSTSSQPKETRHTIVDGCCLPAIMDGQLLRRAKDGVLSEQTFTLE